jgi:hypothetical protein
LKQRIPGGAGNCQGSTPLRVLNLNTMKSLINDLFFDKKLVEQIKEEKLPEGLLYNQLISGKITMAEYLKAV